MAMFRTPKKLGEKIVVVDKDSEWYNKVGHKQACRIDNNVAQVLVFFPIMKTKGALVQLDWDQCRRVI